jgi:hypothetical protein
MIKTAPATSLPPEGGDPGTPPSGGSALQVLQRLKLHASRRKSMALPERLLAVGASVAAVPGGGRRVEGPM